MQSELATEIGRYEHPPQPVRSVEAHAVRRVGPLDRAAMHLGVALIRWGRRPLKADHPERFASDREVAQARRNMELERDLLQALYMTRLR